MIDRIGESVLSFLYQLGRVVILSIKVLKKIFLGQWHFKNVIEQMMRIGVDSLPIVLITSIFVGMVFAVQIVKEFLRFGATSMVGGVLGLALWRELIPLLVGVVVAGRIGAAISAEIGTMKVTEQIQHIS